MTLRYKILAPFAILLACGALVIHFYWLPQYERYSVEQARQAEQKYLRLLATGMTSDLYWLETWPRSTTPWPT